MRCSTGKNLSSNTYEFETDHRGIIFLYLLRGSRHSLSSQTFQLVTSPQLLTDFFIQTPDFVKASFVSLLVRCNLSQLERKGREMIQTSQLGLVEKLSEMNGECT